VAARRRAAIEARTPQTETEDYKNAEGKRLSIEEMRAGRNPNNYTKAVPTERQNDVSRMSPEELRAFSKTDKVELSGDGLERRSLSDPPAPLLKAQGGGRLKASAEPAPVANPDSPDAFIRQQQNRR
jgi:hypothetical protein